MDFDWDAANISHIARHDVTPPEAEAAVADARVAKTGWYLRNGEWRMNILGGTSSRVLYIVITTRDPLVRVVSARDANIPERREYRDTVR